MFHGTRHGSLPSRERGLKSVHVHLAVLPPVVAPLAGAWIEIPMCANHLQCKMVAPLAGAWIEIGSGMTGFNTSFVAPLAGAWIEIGCHGRDISADNSRSPRGSVD